MKNLFTAIINIIQSYGGLKESTQKWYWGRCFCRMCFMRVIPLLERIVFVVGQEASRLWWCIVWQLYMTYSKLSVATSCDTIDVKGFTVSNHIISFQTCVLHILCKTWRLYFLEKDFIYYRKILRPIKEVLPIRRTWMTEAVNVMEGSYKRALSSERK